MSAHIIYESRLDLARLLVADCDESVNCSVAQPFMLRAPFFGKFRHHIPDYLLLTDDGPVVADVEPASLLDDPAVAETFNECASLSNLWAGLSKSRVSSRG